METHSNGRIGDFWVSPNGSRMVSLHWILSIVENRVSTTFKFLGSKYVLHLGRVRLSQIRNKQTVSITIEVNQRNNLNICYVKIIQTLSRPNGDFLSIRTLYISYGHFADHLDTFQHCWQGFSYIASKVFSSSLQPPYVLKRYDISGDLLFSYRATPFTSYCKTGKGAFLAYNYLQEKLSFFQCWMQSCSLFWFLGR